MAAGEPPSIEELLQRSRDGDTAAAEELLARHRDRVRQMIVVRIDERLSARIDPSDVVQEAFSVAYKRLPAFFEKATLSFYPWLRKIAWNCLVDLHRHHIHASKRSVDREEDWQLSNTSAVKLADQFISSGISPMRRLLQEEARARVQTNLARLSPAHREILTLRYLEQLTGPECAEVLGVSQKAANQRHLRAVRRLQDMLKRGMIGDG